MTLINHNQTQASSKDHLSQSHYLVHNMKEALRANSLLSLLKLKNKDYLVDCKDSWDLYYKDVDLNKIIFNSVLFQFSFGQKLKFCVVLVELNPHKV